MRFQASTKSECDAWLVALGVAVQRAKKSVTDERTGLGEIIAKSNHPFIREIMTDAPLGAGAVAAQKLLQQENSRETNNKKKKGFDASTFKKAFKEANTVTTANWQ